ncbi:MAG: M81 family metallopeptidase [Gemmatimonadaceae bacterium]|nr:M81 family metallopeptidase [Gemmatimonadaceae bacterium]
MRIAVGQLKQESNHFNPKLCELEHFEANGVLYGDDVLEGFGPNTELGGAIGELRQHGAQLVPLLLARSVSYGPLTPECFAHLADELVTRLERAGDVDGVYISFHGAMAVTDDDDPEGTVLERVRAVVGPDVPIASSYDLHAHMSPKICRNATIVEGYRTYPHDDGFETGARAASFLVRAVRGEITPKLSITRMNMLVPGTNQQTTYGPAALLWFQAKAAIAKGDVLSASIFCGHSKLDVPEHGFAVVTLTDDDAATGAKLGEAIAAKAWDIRDEFAVQCVPPDEAIERALAVDRGPVVLVDLGDVPGGGSTGDSNALLAAMLRGGVDRLKEPSQVSIVDPAVVERCHEAGVGAELTVDIGCSMQPSLGDPISVTGVVTTLHDGRFVYAMGNLAGSPGSMGRCAVLKIGAIHVLVSTYPSYEYADEQYRAVGLDMDRCRITVARAGMNFKLAFQCRARHTILVDSPGPTAVDLTRLPFERVTRPTYPFDPIDAPTIRTETP